MPGRFLNLVFAIAMFAGTMALPIAWRLRAADRFENYRALTLAALPPLSEPPAMSGSDEPVDRILAAASERRSDDSPNRCNDATFVRRIYLDLVGVAPTLAEQEAFTRDPSPDRRAALIDQLLADSERAAIHWLPFWEDALASSQITEASGGIGNNGRYREWLLEASGSNRSYDRMVADLLSPTLPRHPPTTANEVNGVAIHTGFLRSDTPQNAVRSAANVAQVFLAASVRCGSCHDHFENPMWTQQRVSALAGMVMGGDLEIVRCENRTGRFAPAAFPFEVEGASSRIDVHGPVLRQEQLARWLVDPNNSRFAQTFVNRLWKRFTGEGLFEPIDDCRDDLVGVRAELLRWLADDFVRHQFDVRHAVRRIVRSAYYQGPTPSDRPTGPDDPPRPIRRRLTAEQWSDSLESVLSQSSSIARAALVETPSELQVKLNRPVTRSEVLTQRSQEFGVLSALELIAGQEFQSRSSASGARMITEAAKLPNELAVRRLFAAIYARMPTDAETAAGVDFLKDVSVDRTAALKDMAWALCAGPEFALAP